MQVKKENFEINSEIASSIIHIAGFIFGIVAISFLIVYASIEGNPWKIVSFSVYGFTLLFLFLFSSLYHGINHSEKIKERLRTFDYIGIFLLIAGTFTPICLVLLRGVFGWTLFGIIWALALIGIIIRMLKVPVWVTSPIYLLMGWLAVLVAKPIYALSKIVFDYALIGGLFYTFGLIIFTMQKPNISKNFTFHEIWHIFVLLGAISHFLLIFFYLL